VSKRQPITNAHVFGIVIGIIFAALVALLNWWLGELPSGGAFPR
jgi:hypothetical protein